jgi:hypothetical protein
MDGLPLLTSTDGWAADGDGPTVSLKRVSERTESAHSERELSHNVRNLTGSRVAMLAECAANLTGVVDACTRFTGFRSKMSKLARWLQGTAQSHAARAAVLSNTHVLKDAAFGSVARWCAVYCAMRVLCC